MTIPASDAHVQAVRHFNRFYTRQIGVLQEHLLESAYSLTEVRVLYELAARPGITASELLQELGLDRGYLSRLLAGFEKRGLIDRKPSERDARQNLIHLTRKGRDSFTPLDEASSREVRGMLARLTAPNQERFIGCLRTVESLLTGNAASEPGYTLRRHRPGDMGWVVQRHGEIYWDEYAWDERFEALVADITAGFIQEYDPQHERCWIAERDGERVGCVFLVKGKQEGEAKLRLLLVEPKARGLGLGKRLVQECVQFAREAGYRTLGLWTNSVLDAARGIYRQQGFKLVHEEKHTSFGQELIGENWELEL